MTETLQLGIWYLDADPSQSHLLRFALNESNIWHTMLLICVSLADPWSILNELQMWLRIVQQHVARLKLAPGELQALRCSSKWPRKVRCGQIWFGSKTPSNSPWQSALLVLFSSSNKTNRSDGCVTILGKQSGSAHAFCTIQPRITVTHHDNQQPNEHLSKLDSSVRLLLATTNNIHW